MEKTGSDHRRLERAWTGSIFLLKEGEQGRWGGGGGGGGRGGGGGGGGKGGRGMGSG